MHTCILSLGSNCCAENVEKAILWLRKTLIISDASALYITPPAKGEGLSYTNAVVRVETDMSIEELNSRFKNYERNVGRDDNCRRTQCVPIDIDIVIYDGEIIREWDFRQTFFRLGYDMLIK